MLSLAFPVKMLAALGVAGGADAGDAETVLRVRGGAHASAALWRAGRMADVPDDQRTEKPTQRRLERARKEGNFPSSREFVSAVQFTGFVALMRDCSAEPLAAARAGC